MGLIFNRTPADARRARKMHESGAQLYHVELQYAEGFDMNVTLNQIAAEGWDLAFSHIVHVGDQIWGIYLFKRRDVPAAS